MVGLTKIVTKHGPSLLTRTSRWPVSQPDQAGRCSLIQQSGSRAAAAVPHHSLELNQVVKRKVAPFKMW